MATGLTTVVPAVRPIVKLLLVSLVNTSPIQDLCLNISSVWQIQ